MEAIKIRNKARELIDALVEGKADAKETVVFAHGLGTNKDENGLFVDLAAALADQFRIVRFDFSGYGKSEGLQEATDLKKQAEDLDAVLNYVRQNFPGEIHLYAHSLGTSAVSLLSPDGIAKTIYSGIPGADYLAGIERMKERILSRGGTVDESGISIYPRKDGAIQKIGPSFWKVRREFDPLKVLRSFAAKTKLIIFKPQQDEITGNDDFAEYEQMPGIRYVELPGTHGFSDPEDRENLIQKVKEFLAA